MPVGVAVVGDELDVRPAFGHAPDEGEVTAYGPQPSRRWYVVIAAINYEDSSRRSLLAHPPDHRIRGLIEGTGERLELLDCNRRRRAHPLHPAPLGLKRRSFVEQAAKTTHEAGSPCRFIIWLDWSLEPASECADGKSRPVVSKAGGSGRFNRADGVNIVF